MISSGKSAVLALSEERELVQSLSAELPELVEEPLSPELEDPEVVEGTGDEQAAIIKPKASSKNKIRFIFFSYPYFGRT